MGRDMPQGNIVAAPQPCSRATRGAQATARAVVLCGPSLVGLAMPGHRQSGKATWSAAACTPVERGSGLLPVSTGECRNRHLQTLGPVGPQPRPIRGTPKAKCGAVRRDTRDPHGARPRSTGTNLGSIPRLDVQLS